MWTMKPIIVFVMLFVPSFCGNQTHMDLLFQMLGTPPPPPPESDFGSPEEFLKEVNDFRAKFAKEHKIPNMYKLLWSNEFADAIGGRIEIHHDGHRLLMFDSYWNVTEAIEKDVNVLKNGINDIKYHDGYWVNALSSNNIDLLHPLQGLVGCSSSWDTDYESWNLECYIGFANTINFWYSNPGEAGSQCPPRFKGEDGLCVPVDPSKNTFWGTEDQLLEDVNYMRRKYAKEFGIPNMHQLTWNDSLVEALNEIKVERRELNIIRSQTEYILSNDSSSDGFGKSWLITELPSFSAGIATIDEAVHVKLVLNRENDKVLIRGKEEDNYPTELIHPLQTSIGCMGKATGSGDMKPMFVLCLLGNMGQWPSDWKWDLNSTKIPGSECMDGYVNDDGLCILAPPTTTPDPTTTTPGVPTTPKTTPTEAVPTIPKKTEVSDEKEKKEGASVDGDASLEPGQEALESSGITRIYSYGLLILLFICLLF